MRLSRLAVKNFKGLEAFEAQFAPGINIVHGPNEAGKSTLLEALWAACYTVATTSAASAVGSWVPWGSAATPEVELEFFASGSHYRLHKLFARSKGQATLQELPEQRIVADAPRKVDDTMGAILRLGDAAVALTCWAKQGEILRSLSEVGSKAELRGALRAAGAAAASSIDVLKIVERMKRTTCPPSEVKRLAAELADAAARARRMQDARDARLKSQRQAESDALRLVEVKRLLGEMAPRMDADAKCRSAEQARDGALAAFKVADDKLKAAREAESRLDALATETAAVDAALEAGREALAAAEGASKHIKAAARRAELAAMLDTVAEREKQLALIQPEANAPAPGEWDLAEFEENDRRAVQLRARIDASQIKLDVTALRDIELVTPAGPNDLATGACHTASGDADVEVEIRGVARIRVRGPVVDIGESRDELTRLEATMTRALDAWHATSLAEARERARRVEHAARETKRLRAEVQGLLGGRAQQVVADEVALLDEALAGHAADDAARMSADEAERARNDAASSIAKLEERSRNLEAGRREWQARTGDVDALRTRQEEASIAYIAAKTAAEALAPFKLPPDEHIRLKRDRAELERESVAIDARARVRTESAATSSEDDLVRAEGERDEIERQLRSLNRERAAYDMIEDAYRRAQEEFASSEAESIAGALDRMLPSLTSGRYASATIDEQLEVKSVSHADANAGAAPVESLSFGAREQIALAMRLAAAEALSGGETQLVVLDEAIIGFDEDRLSGTCALLAECAKTMQVVIMTARPDLLSFPKGTDVNRIDVTGRRDATKAGTARGSPRRGRRPGKRGKGRTAPD
jgi:exonuclease SbcC